MFKQTRRTIDEESFGENFATGRNKRKKFAKASKSLEAEGGFLRMEIFVGTYMRRWFSPCQSVRAQAKGVEMGCFRVLGLFQGFSILDYIAKS